MFTGSLVDTVGATQHCYTHLPARQLACYIANHLASYRSSYLAITANQRNMAAGSEPMSQKGNSEGTRCEHFFGDVKLKFATLYQLADVSWFTALPSVCYLIVALVSLSRACFCASVSILALSLLLSSSFRLVSVLFFSCCLFLSTVCQMYNKHTL